MTIWRQFATVWIVALWAAPAPAIEINPGADETNRFSSGYPNGPLAPNTNPNFIGLDYDWSGVGWMQANPNTSLALLTPRQVLMANHYKQSGAIQFLSANGQVTSAEVQYGNWQNAGVPTDLATGTFTAPLPPSAGIQPYSILFLGYDPNQYLGYNLLNYGWVASIGWNKINSIFTGQAVGQGGESSYYFDYLADAATPERTLLESGDSGSPSFIATGSPGTMYLVGAHWAIYRNYSGSLDTFLPMSLPLLDSDTAPTGYLPSVVTPTTARWTGTASGTWGAGGNWSSGAVPNDVLTGGQATACASVLFDGLAGPQCSITLSGAQAVTSLAFNLTPSTTGGFTFSGGTLTLGEAGLTNNDVHAQTFNNAVVLRASQEWHAGAGGLNITASGSLNLGTGQLLYIDGSGNSDLEGAISGSGSSIAKDGSGTLILGNANNSFSGQIFVHNGTLQFASIQNVGGGNSALGAPATVANGTIYLAGTLAYAGSGSSSNRVIDVADGPAAIGATTGVIDASGGGPLTLTGGVICENNGYTSPITGTSSLVLQGSGSGSEGGTVSNGGTCNVMSLVKTGSGTWTLSGPNTYTGTTTVNGGLLALSGNGGIAQSAALTVSRGTVELDDSTLGNNFSSSRLGNQPISLQGGVLSVNLGSVSGGTETIGPVTAAMGENTLALATSAGSGIGHQVLLVGGGSLARTPGATLNFTGALSGGYPLAGDGMAFSGMSSGSNFIDAGTFVNGADYAVYDAGGYVRAMVAGSNASDYALSVTSSRHVLLTSTVTAQPSIALLTLSLSGAGAGFSLASTATLTLSAGGILKTGGGTATISGGAGLSTTGEYVLRADTPGDQLAITAPLGGGTGLTKSGLGTLALGAINSYGGPTTIDAGTLTTTVAGAIPSTSPLVIGSAASLDLGGQSQTVAGITLYDGSVQNSGAAAALTLGGSAAGVTYAGVGSGSSISGGTLNLAGDPLAGGGSGGSHAFSVARGQGSVDLNVLADVADGSGGGQSLLKTGNGILQLSGTNSFSGGTQIQAGTLTLGSNYAIPAASSLTLAAGTLNLGGFANTAASLVMQDGLIDGSGSFAAATFNLQNGALAGSLAGAGSLSKTTSGVVTITSSNGYSGGTTLSGGTLVVSADNNLGATGGPLTLDGGTLQVLGTSFASTLRPVAMTSNGGGIDVADPNNTFTLAAQNLSGSGAFSKSGQGALQLGGSLGSTAITVQDGTLQLAGNASQLTANPSLSLWNVATFSLANHNESVSAINLTGGTINTGTGTLTLSGSLNYAQSIWPATIEGNLSLGTSAGAFSVNLGESTDLAVAATISGSPASGLVKTGNGLLTLSGTNTYGGGTTFSGGTLAVSADDNLGSAAGGLTFDGGTLEVLGTSCTSTGRPVTTTSNGGGICVANPNNTLTLTAPYIGGSGAFLKAGPGAMQVSGSIGNAAITVQSGALLLTGSASQLTANPALGLGSAATFSFSNHNESLSAINMSGGTINTGTGTLTLSGNLNYSGSTSPAVIQGNLSLGTGAGFCVNPGSSTGVTIAANISGGSAAGLLKTGDGLLTLSGTNTYTGGTRINGGNVVFSSTSAIPASGTILLDGPGVLDVTGAYSTVTSWLTSGKLSAASVGILALSGTSNESINLTGYDGILLGAAAAGATYSGVLTPSGTTYALGGGGGTLVVTSNLTGADSLLVGGGGLGTVVLSGTNTYTGGTDVTSGTLKILSTLALSGGELTVGADASLLFGDDLPAVSRPSAESLDLLAPGGGSLSNSDPASSLFSAMNTSVVLPATSQPASNSVPEPATLWLLLAAGGSGLLWRVRRQGSLRLWERGRG
jgi:autotransporter-associated beta strand protein